MPLSSKVIRVPVRLVDGHWELQYGGAVKVKEGAIGELHIDRANFNDAAFLKALTERRRVQVLPAGTDLRVALTIKAGLDPSLRPHLLAYDATPHDHTIKISGETRFVSIGLAGSTKAQELRQVDGSGLWLILEGMEPLGIESGVMNLPKTHGLEAVDSLNYAFTRLSEVFEPWRKAHTGSIYERVFYREPNNRWYALKDLRDRALAIAERQLIKGLWSNVAAEFSTKKK